MLTCVVCILQLVLARRLAAIVTWSQTGSVSINYPRFGWVIVTNFILASHLFKTRIDVNFKIFKPNLSRQQPMLVDDPEKWSGFFADEHLAIRPVYFSPVYRNYSLKAKENSLTVWLDQNFYYKSDLLKFNSKLNANILISCRKLLCSPSKPRKRMLHQSETDPRMTF